MLKRIPPAGETLILAGLAIAALCCLGCFDFTNLLNNPTSLDGSGTGGSCDGLVTAVQLDKETGFDGGVAFVGRVVTLSAQALGNGAPLVPGTQGQISGSAVGTCQLQGASGDVVSVLPTAPGSCTVVAAFCGVTSNPIAFDVVSP
jgi:hypothetical protein